MIRILLDRAFDNEHHYIHAVGLSTDTKPTKGIITGSKFVAVETGAGYLFDETAGKWNENQQLSEAVAAYLDEHPEALDEAAIEAIFDERLDGIEEDVGGLKSAITGMTTATAEDEGKALKAKTVSGGKVTAWEFGETGGGSGLSSDVKAALLACFEHVAWIDEDGQDYYDALNAALNPPASLASIDAVYTQSGTVYSGASLDTLKTDLVVTAYYDGGNSEVLSPSAYTLSGTLTAGASVVTVTFGGKTDTFSVQVTGSSGMDGWTDGVAYRNLEIVQNEYCKAADGSFVSYNGWDRTGYVPCDGAGSITFPPFTGASSVSACGSNRFFDQNHNVVTGQITLSLTETKTIIVPSGAYYFVLSCESAPLAACINDGIIPHEAGV